MTISTQPRTRAYSDGSEINPLAMVKLAHSITPDDIPAIVRLRVLNETPVFSGKDFFDPQPSEVLTNTPAVIARVFRGAAYKRKIRVSAEDSFDLNYRDLKFHWVLLRGDAEKVRITPQDEQQSTVNIEVSYQPRAPIVDGSVASNRIDIGVFAHNGKYFSAPAFITWFSLDHESRVYADDGRVLEIAYGLGTVKTQVNSWTALLDLLKPDAQSLAGRLIKRSFPEKQQEKLFAFLQELATLESLLRETEANLENSSDDLKDELRTQRDSARNNFNDFKNVNRSGLDGLSIEKTIQTALSRLSEDFDLVSRHQNEFEQLIESVELDKQHTILESRDQLVDYGIARLNDVSSRKLSLKHS